MDCKWQRWTEHNCIHSFRSLKFFLTFETPFVLQSYYRKDDPLYNNRAIHWQMFQRLLATLWQFFYRVSESDRGYWQPFTNFSEGVATLANSMYLS
jgi:hypothetical protein